jgi:hypothetical protein
MQVQQVRAEVSLCVRTFESRLFVVCLPPPPPLSFFKRQKTKKMSDEVFDSSQYFGHSFDPALKAPPPLSYTGWETGNVYFIGTTPILNEQEGGQSQTKIPDQKQKSKKQK